ncbi:MAG: hypothetical protein N3C63_08285 [Rhodocyclaceae bacterium]|nr:hypothetical protein [Rhodocyclaceae bacterium]
MKAALAAIITAFLAACAPLNPPPEALPQPAKATAPCAIPTRPKVLVTAFPLRAPEQLGLGEFFAWPQATAEELARALARSGRLRAAAAPQQVAFASLTGEPELSRDAAGAPQLIAWAKEAGAQYVIAGLILDFGRSTHWLVVPERGLALEARLYDGLTGRLLARQAFERRERFAGPLPYHLTPGTREFATTRFGAAYQELIAALTDWAEAAIACRPLAVRVTRIEGRRLTLEGGFDAGLFPGAALSLAPPSGPGAPRPDAWVREVKADQAIAELGFHRDPQAIRPGEAFYLLARP